MVLAIVNGKKKRNLEDDMYEMEQVHDDEIYDWSFRALQDEIALL